MDNEEISFHFTAGIFTRRFFRNFLIDEVFEGSIIRWKEQRGWLDSTFHVCGNVSDVKAIEYKIRDYMTVITRT